MINPSTGPPKNRRKVQLDVWYPCPGVALPNPPVSWVHEGLKLESRLRAFGEPAELRASPALRKGWLPT